MHDSGITLAVEGKGRPGAKKRPPTPRDVPWGELGAGRVQVEFGRPEAGAREDDADRDLPAHDIADDDGGEK